MNIQGHVVDTLPTSLVMQRADGQAGLVRDQMKDWRYFEFWIDHYRRMIDAEEAAILQYLDISRTRTNQFPEEEGAIENARQLVRLLHQMIRSLEADRADHGLG